MQGLGWSKAGGRLTVDHNAVILEPDRPTRCLSGASRVVHSKPSVLVLEGCLVPPWSNTSVLIEGEQSACVVVPVWVRSSLLQTLTAAGFG